jgi:hypothetical protein
VEERRQPDTRGGESCRATPAKGHRRPEGDEGGKMDWHLLVVIGVIAVIVLLGVAGRGLGAG